MSELELALQAVIGVFAELSKEGKTPSIRTYDFSTPKPESICKSRSVMLTKPIIDIRLEHRYAPDTAEIREYQSAMAGVRLYFPKIRFRLSNNYETDN